MLYTVTRLTWNVSTETDHKKVVAICSSYDAALSIVEEYEENDCGDEFDIEGPFTLDVAKDD